MGYRKGERASPLVNLTAAEVVVGAIHQLPLKAELAFKPLGGEASRSHIAAVGKMNHIREVQGVLVAAFRCDSTKRNPLPFGNLGVAQWQKPQVSRSQPETDAQSGCEWVHLASHPVTAEGIEQLFGIRDLFRRVQDSLRRRPVTASRAIATWRNALIRSSAWSQTTSNELLVTV